MHFDVILKNGKIIDGKGNPWFRADLGVKDSRIQIIRPHIQGDAQEIIDIRQYFVSPGFIDSHTHSDYVFFIDATAQSKVRQGVTTEVIGNCGMSAAPYIGAAKDKVGPAKYQFTPFWNSIPEYLDAISKQSKTVNISPLIGHGTLRLSVLGSEDRAPTDEELARMKHLLSEGLEAGAFGLSTGLYFAPGAYATEKELVDLGKIVSHYGTVLTSHIRDEGSRSIGFIPAVNEIVHIGRQASVPVQISHIKSFGPDTWHTSDSVLRIIEEARIEGIDVTCDQYPYDTTGGGLAADTLPYSFQDGKSSQQISDMLKNTDARHAIKAEVAINIDKRGGPDVLTISTYSANPDLEGKTLRKICEEWDKDPAETVMDMLSVSTAANWNCRSLNQDDVDAFMQYPATMVGSDGSSLSTQGPLSGGNPHPRNYGAFPHVINEYVRKRGVLKLEDAIRKMTSLPAQRFLLNDRGTLEKGNWADLVIFDFESVRDATFENPKQYPEGIPYVMVNGQWVIKENQFTGHLPGRLAGRK